MKRLHILKKTNNPDAEKLMTFQSEKGEEVEVILIQDAVFLQDIGPDLKMAVCREDAEARNVTHHDTLLGYGEILKRVMETDSVVFW